MFQEALIESLPHRTRNAGTIAASTGIHLIVLGGLAWFSLARFADVVENEPPAMVPALLVGLDPLRLGDGGPRDAATKVGPHRAPLPRQARLEGVQPTNEMPHEVKEVPPDESGDEPTSAGAGSAVESGGSPKGVLDGDGRDLGTLIGPKDDTFLPARVDQPPVLILRVEPVYPEAARRLHQSGLVALHAVINATGRVEDLRVVKSAGDLFDAAAISAVERWIYRPATLNGRAVRVLLTVTVDFALH